MAKKGIAAVNMRTVASECGIALGSLYNYFSSKSELLSATIEAVWKDIFQMGKTLEKCENIVEYLNLLFEGVENSRSRYPKFFSMHALGFTAGERQEGKKAMEVYFLRLKNQMAHFLENDEKICIYGDYDCDGILSTAILVQAFLELGKKVGYHIPNRFEDGYGLNKERVQQMYEKGYSLLITVDNGIKAYEAIDLANELGIDVIVIDHHDYDELPDACAIIHTKMSPDLSLIHI